MKVFGSEHLMFLLYSVILYIILLYLPGFIGISKQTIRKIFAWLVLAGKVTELIYQFFFLPSVPWVHHLPLHLCDIAHILSIIMLFTGSKRIFEILYFWSIGAVIANITPEIGAQATLVRKLFFFSNHTFIVLAVGLMERYYDFRPRFRTILKAWGILVVYALPIIPLNLVLKTNFLFLRNKPAGGSAMDYLGPWPYYIVSLLFVVLGVFIVMYLKYFIKDKFSKTKY